jgi:UDP:flavonoid glycosyltransferase YjiC (YdhE family)
MRVLFVTWAWPSHLYALVPFAWACRNDGHEVLMASQPGLLAELLATGLPAATVGADVDATAMVRDYALPREQDRPRQTGTGGPAGRGPRALQMFTRLAEAMTGELIELGRRWQPELIVYEPTALAGPLAAAALGVPAVRHLYGTDLMLRARPVLPTALEPLMREHGIDEVEPFGVATLDPTPASLQLPGDYRRLQVRHVSYNGPGRLPAMPPARPGRPRVLITWGHTMAKLAPDRFLAGEVARALAPDTGRLDLVLAISSAQRPLLGAVPDEATVLVDTPIDLVLPGCELVVAHGGASTVLTALGHGVPLLLIPQLPDHAGHAARVLAAGVGEVLTRDEASPEAIREQVAGLLRGPQPAAAAGVAAEMAKQPTGPQVLAELTDLIRP